MQSLWFVQSGIQGMTNNRKERKTGIKKDEKTRSRYKTWFYVLANVYFYSTKKSAIVWVEQLLAPAIL